MTGIHLIPPNLPLCLPLFSYLSLPSFSKVILSFPSLPIFNSGWAKFTLSIIFPYKQTFDSLLYFIILYFNIFPCFPSITLYSPVFSRVPLYSQFIPFPYKYAFDFLIYFIILYSPIFPCICLFFPVFPVLPCIPCMPLHSPECLCMSLYS